MRLPRVVAGDRGACARGRPRPMLGQGRPYSVMSFVVKSRRPVGIAGMALLSKYLQHTAVDGNNTPRRRRRREAEARRSERAGGKGDAIAENGGGRPRCLCGWAATAHAGSRASVRTG
jgi:hypothetical protein